MRSRRSACRTTGTRTSPPTALPAKYASQSFCRPSADLIGRLVRHVGHHRDRFDRWTCERRPSLAGWSHRRSTVVAVSAVVVVSCWSRRGGGASYVRRAAVLLRPPAARWSHRDPAHAMEATEVDEGERVPRFGLLPGPSGQPARGSTPRTRPSCGLVHVYARPHRAGRRPSGCEHGSGGSRSHRVPDHRLAPLSRAVIDHRRRSLGIGQLHHNRRRLASIFVPLSCAEGPRRAPSPELHPTQLAGGVDRPALPRATLSTADDLPPSGQPGPSRRYRSASSTPTIDDVLRVEAGKLIRFDQVDVGCHE